MGIKNVFKWRITTNKYLYLVDEEDKNPFILDKKTGERTYPYPLDGTIVNDTTIVTGVTLDEGLISQIVSNIKNAETYSTKFRRMVSLASFDNDAKKLTFLSYDNYFNLDDAECVEEAVTPKCEGYEPVFNVSAYTIDETEVTYAFYAERNESDKTLRYNLNLGIPRGEKGEKGDDGIGVKGDPGEPGKEAVIRNVSADIHSLEYGESPVVSVTKTDVPGTTGTTSNEYDLSFDFQIPGGKQGQRGAPGESGADGYSARVVDLITEVESLSPGSNPYVEQINSGTTIYKNDEYRTYDTTFELKFGIPSGLEGSKGDNGANAEIRNVTASVIETLDPGYEDPDTGEWIPNNAEAGVDVTPPQGGNIIDLNFWFKIPRGRQGEKGDSGGGGGGGGGIYYTFTTEVASSSTITVPELDFNLIYDSATAKTYNLSFKYPEDWGGGGGAECDDDCRKHRYDHYQNSSDSLSEGMVQTINGIVYPLSAAQGIRSHAEGIGMDASPDGFFTDCFVKGDTNEDVIRIPRDIIPMGAEISSIVGSKLYLNSEEVIINVNFTPPVPAGVNPDDFYEAIKNAEMTIVYADFDDDETHYVNYDNVVVEYTISGITYQSDLGSLVTNEILDGNNIELVFALGTPNAVGVATHTEGRGCQAVGDYSHAEGWETLSNGAHSHTEGLGTYTTNLSEHAEGQYNVSHSENRTEFSNLNGCNTVSSIGIGDDSRKNAVEVMQNGDMYIYGVGKYFGTDIKCQNREIETLQDVLNRLRSDADKAKEIRELVIPVILPEYTDSYEPSNASIGEYWYDTGNEFLMIYKSVTVSGTTTNKWVQADNSLKFIDDDREHLHVYDAIEGEWVTEQGDVDCLYLSKNTNDLFVWDETQELFVPFSNDEIPSVYFIKVSEVYESVPQSIPANMLHEYVLINDGHDYILYQGVYDENATTHVVFEEITDPIYTNAIYFDSSDNATLYFNSDTEFDENKFQEDSTGFLENVYYVNIINGDVYGLNNGELVLLSVITLPETLTLNCNTEHRSQVYKPLMTVINQKLVNYTKPGNYTVNVLNNESSLVTVFTLEVEEKPSGNTTKRTQRLYNNDVSYTREQFKNAGNSHNSWGQWSRWEVFFYRDAVNFELRNITTPITSVTQANVTYEYSDSNIGVTVFSQDMEFVRLNEEYITVRMYRKINKNRINKFRLIYSPIRDNSNVMYTPINIPLSKCVRSKNSTIYKLPLSVKNCMDGLIHIMGYVITDNVMKFVSNLNHIMYYGCGNENTPNIVVNRKGIDKLTKNTFSTYGYRNGFAYDTDDFGKSTPSISIILGINVVLGNETTVRSHYNASPIQPCRFRVMTQYIPDQGGQDPTPVILYGMSQLFNKKLMR